MIKYHEEIEQGTPEWFAVRCGLLTASEMKNMITPALKVAKNDKVKSHVYEIAAQRMTKYVEPSYMSYDMLRGCEDEIEAKIKYDENYADVTDMGFITNDKWGFTLGYSPDWLIGKDGQAECKSRIQKLQFKTIVEQAVPVENIIQVQSGLLISERKWCDYVSYSGGMPMFVHRVYPDKEIHNAIIEASEIFEKQIKEHILIYKNKIRKLIPTERKIEGDII